VISAATTVAIRADKGADRNFAMLGIGDALSRGLRRLRAVSGQESLRDQRNLGD